MKFHYLARLRTGCAWLTASSFYIIPMLRAREKVVASSYLFKTSVLPLQMVPAIVAVSFFVGIAVNVIVRYPESLQQTGLTIVATVFTIFWGSLLCLGLISLIFNKMIIEEDGITFQGLRIFKYTRFLMYLSFD